MLLSELYIIIHVTTPCLMSEAKDAKPVETKPDTKTETKGENAEVLVTKIDEKETELYRHHVKSYRFDTSEWKERGEGDLVLAKSEKCVRALMHRDLTGKCAINFPLKGCTISNLNNNKKAVTVSCVDFSDNTDKPTVFAFRFKDEAEADNFKKLLKEHGEDMKLDAKEDVEK